jgi:hypothetical protein
VATDGNKDISAIFREGTLVDEAIHAGVMGALVRHKEAGQPLVVCRDGKIVYISADEALANIEAQEKAAQDP